MRANLVAVISLWRLATTFQIQIQIQRATVVVKTVDQKIAVELPTIFRGVCYEHLPRWSFTAVTELMSLATETLRQLSQTYRPMSVQMQIFQR